jgi:hypothetical protein
LYYLHPIDFGLQDVAASQLTVGARGSSSPPSEYLDGEIGEIIVFDRVLTNGSIAPSQNEVNDVRYYLDQKWGLGLGVRPTPSPAVPALSLLGQVALASMLVWGAFRFQKRSQA